MSAFLMYAQQNRRSLQSENPDTKRRHIAPARRVVEEYKSLQKTTAQGKGRGRTEDGLQGECALFCFGLEYRTRRIGISSIELDVATLERTLNGSLFRLLQPPSTTDAQNAATSHCWMRRGNCCARIIDANAIRKKTHKSIGNNTRL